MYRSIIISGLPGSGKNSLISRLHAHYETYEPGEWKVHPIGDMFRQRWEALPDEDKKTGFNEWWKNLPAGEQRKVNEELLEIVRKGKVIADTRYAKYLANNDGLLVFVTAPLDVRARRAFENKLPKYAGKSMEEIKRELCEREEAEVSIGIGLFGFDYTLKADYNLVLETDKMSVDEEFAKMLERMKCN